jgi:hypothetical protein
LNAHEDLDLQIRRLKPFATLKSVPVLHMRTTLRDNNNRRLLVAEAACSWLIASRTSFRLWRRWYRVVCS